MEVVAEVKRGCVSGGIVNDGVRIEGGVILIGDCVVGEDQVVERGILCHGRVEIVIVEVDDYLFSVLGDDSVAATLYRLWNDTDNLSPEIQLKAERVVLTVVEDFPGLVPQRVDTCTVDVDPVHVIGQVLREANHNLFGNITQADEADRDINIIDVTEHTVEASSSDGNGTE